MISVGSSSFGAKKDPNQEFFQMLLLSYKMNNQDLEEVMELDHKEMYRQCTQDQKVSFFQFNEWISKEISRIRYRKFYQQNKRRLERNKRLLNKLEAMDGVRLVQDVQIVEDYMWVEWDGFYEENRAVRAESNSGCRLVEDSSKNAYSIFWQSLLSNYKDDHKNS